MKIENKDKLNISNHQQQQLEQMKAVKSIAKSMEGEFAKIMLREMRKTAPSTQPEGQAEQIYKSLLDEEYVNVMTEKGDLGIQKIITDQLLPKSAATINLPHKGNHHGN